MNDSLSIALNVSSFGMSSAALFLVLRDKYRFRAAHRSAKRGAELAQDLIDGLERIELDPHTHVEVADLVSAREWARYIRPAHGDVLFAVVNAAMTLLDNRVEEIDAHGLGAFLDQVDPGQLASTDTNTVAACRVGRSLVQHWLSNGEVCSNCVEGVDDLPIDVTYKTVGYVVRAFHGYVSTTARTSQQDTYGG